MQNNIKRTALYFCMHPFSFFMIIIHDCNRSLPLPRMEPDPPSIDASLPVPTGEVVKKGPVTPPEPFVSQGKSFMKYFSS